MITISSSETTFIFKLLMLCRLAWLSIKSYSCVVEVDGSGIVTTSEIINKIQLNYAKRNKRTMMVLYRSPEQNRFAYLLLKFQQSSLLRIL